MCGRARIPCSCCVCICQCWDHIETETREDVTYEWKPEKILSIDGEPADDKAICFTVGKDGDPIAEIRRKEDNELIRTVKRGDDITVLFDRGDPFLVEMWR